MTPMRKAAALFALSALLQGCAAGTGAQARPERSSLGCMQGVVAARVPAGIPDKRAHCLAAGFIARECSVTEAWIASYGKELRDLLGGGDAEWGDLTADGTGVDCARAARSDQDLVACCARGSGQD
jgi:hypothetical protein